jgi:hypothetical protein
MPGGELGVEAFLAVVPDVDLRSRERPAVDGAHLAVEGEPDAALVLAHRQRRLRGESGCARHIKRALDRAFAAVPVGGGDLLDDVLDEHIEEQRPFAVVAHLDEPGLERVVLR